MAEIVEETEKHIHYATRFKSNEFKIKNRADAISHATCGMAIDINAKAIAVSHAPHKLKRYASNKQRIAAAT